MEVTDRVVLIDGNGTEGGNVLETANKWQSASLSYEVYIANGKEVETLCLAHAPTDWMVIAVADGVQTMSTCNHIESFFNYANKMGISVVTVYRTRTTLITIGTEFYLDRPNDS